MCVRAFWEHNVRLKTDSCKEGPQRGVSALAPAGMMGDRPKKPLVVGDE
jgi:cytochrome c